jgi:hypothetical protein
MSYKYTSYGRHKKLQVGGKWIGIKITDEFTFTWQKFLEDARKRKISTGKRFAEIIEELNIDQTQIFEGKKSRNIKKILSEYYG